MIVFLTFENESDREKFNYIYENYKGLLLYKAYTVLHDYGLAEDAISEAFLRIYKNLDKVEDVCSGTSISFFVTITKNVAITILNKQQKHPTVLYDDIEEADDFNLEHLLLTKDATAHILDVIDTLKEDLKTPFLLKYAYDLSHREIGHSLHISENNVTVRIHRAKKKLMTLLSKEGNFYEL